jgi:putative tryptophan/tyrosine transport system substrate-binding protein
MRRREFITVLAGATAWPLAARAKDATKIYRVGWFYSSLPLSQMFGFDPPDAVSSAFVSGLRDLRYIEGENLVLERRSAEGHFERIDEIATELVGRKPDVILTGSGDFLAQAILRVTRSVPIVVPTMFDPEKDGLVANLAHPGGNVTGFLEYTGPEFDTKRLQLLKQAVPKARRVDFLGLKDVWAGSAAQAVRDAATVLGVTLNFVEHTPTDFGNAFAVITGDRPDAIFVAYHPSIYVKRQLIADFALEQRIPAIFPYREAVMVGGLMSYSANASDQFRRAAGVIDKILKGTKPADIPVERPVRLELVINLKTAKAMGFIFPPDLLALANEVVE